MCEVFVLVNVFLEQIAHCLRTKWLIYLHCNYLLLSVDTNDGNELIFTEKWNFKYKLFRKQIHYSHYPLSRNIEQWIRVCSMIFHRYVTTLIEFVAFELSGLFYMTANIIMKNVIKARLRSVSDSMTKW